MPHRSNMKIRQTIARGTLGTIVGSITSMTCIGFACVVLEAPHRLEERDFPTDFQRVVYVVGSAVCGIVTGAVTVYLGQWQLRERWRNVIVGTLCGAGLHASATLAGAIEILYGELMNIQPWLVPRANASKLIQSGVAGEAFLEKIGAACGCLAFASDAQFGGIVLENAKGDLPHEGEVLGSVAIFNAARVFVKGYIQLPM